MRINKFLASCGVASRRTADKIIQEGKVSVNGKIVKELGIDINEDNDVVKVEGKRVNLVKRFYYFIINKPKGCVTTASDEHDRKTILDYIQESRRIRLFPIGRLDYDTEGLLIVTNDGDLAYQLTHPKHEVSKTYVVNVEGILEDADLNPLREGVEIDGKKTNNANVKLVAQEEKTTRIEITITEGRNRQVRKMIEIGLNGRRIDFLKRTKIGDLKVGGLSRGEYRELKPAEIAYLKTLAK